MSVAPTAPAISPVLLLGHDELAAASATALAEAEAAVVHLPDPADDVLRAALADGPRSVLVAGRDDIQVLRFALLVEHLRPGVPLVVTIFDRTVAEEIRRSVANCTVVSLADVAVPALAGPCLHDDFALLRRRPEGAFEAVVRDWSAAQATGSRWTTIPYRPRDASWTRRAWRWITSQGRPLDGGARMLQLGLAGLLAVLLIDTALAIAVHGENVPDALYAAVKTIATVGPNAGADHGPPWFKLVSAALIAATVGLTAAFTAGLVNRLLDDRLTALVGRRTAPRRDHVIVVGLGHVGLRLCRALRAAGVPVIAVEQDRDSPHLRIVRALGIPAVIGRGGDRYLLRRLGAERARALAAVTSDDVTNIAACVAARAVAPDLRIVLRAGDGDVTAESQALFRLGTACDVLRLTAAVLAAAATGLPAREAFLDEHRVVLVQPDGRVG